MSYKTKCPKCGDRLRYITTVQQIHEIDSELFAKSGNVDCIRLIEVCGILEEFMICLNCRRKYKMESLNEG